MKITILAAMTPEGIIGKDGKLPWHIPQELAHFKQMTLSKPLIIGRKTFDSLKRRSLPGRDMIILSHSLEEGPGYKVAHSTDQALQLAGTCDEVIIAGGNQIYEKFLNIATHMVLSIIHHHYEGNIYFPHINFSAWELIREEVHEDFTIRFLQRVGVLS